MEWQVSLRYVVGSDTFSRYSGILAPIETPIGFQLETPGSKSIACDPSIATPAVKMAGRTYAALDRSLSGIEHINVNPQDRRSSRLPGIPNTSRIRPTRVGSGAKERRYVRRLTVATVEQVREAIHRAPFLGFDLRLVDGRSFHVRHPDFLAVPPRDRGRELTFYDDDCRMHRIDLLLVVEVDEPPLPESTASPNGQGM
jgi:hypothetical protein